MSLKKSKFELVNRGFSKTLVLISGWATDYRVFENLDLEYNYLFAKQFSYTNFNQELLDVLEQNKIERVSFFGWSQGAFLATDFALKNPHKTDELFLLSVRKRYEKNSLRQVKENLEKNKVECLSKFYADCFSTFDNEGAGWFKKNLLNSYLKEMAIEDLIGGLDYLAFAEIKPELLGGFSKIKIFHGRLDRIAPFIEAQRIEEELRQATLIDFPKLGHNLFLNREFQERFSL